MARRQRPWWNPGPGRLSDTRCRSCPVRSVSPSHETSSHPNCGWLVSRAFAAILLGRDGHDVKIYERSSSCFARRGAGLVPQPIFSREICEDGRRRPNIVAYIQRIAARPSVAAAHAREAEIPTVT